MSKEETCTYCGSAVEADSEFCSNCGASLRVVESTSSVRIISESQPSYTVTQPAQQTQTYHPQPTTVYVPQRQNDSQGTLALVFAILGCVGILPCIGPIVAIIIGNQARSSSNASLGVTLGWISICLNIIGILFFAFSFIWWW